MRMMEHCFSGGVSSAAGPPIATGIEQRWALSDARRAKRLGFGMTGGAASSGERTPDRVTNGKSHIDRHCPFDRGLPGHRVARAARQPAGQ